MAWWIWIVFGIVLLVGELATPGGLFLLFFGIAAVIVGFLDFLGIAGPAWMQWLLFSAISIGALALFRKPLLEKLSHRSTEDVDALVGEAALVLEEIPANAIGKAELRGSPWSVRNVGDRPLVRGQRVRVERVDGLMLLVREEQLVDETRP